MEPGSIVEFFEEKRIHCGVVLELKGGDSVSWPRTAGSSPYLPSASCMPDLPWPWTA